MKLRDSGEGGDVAEPKLACALAVAVVEPRGSAARLLGPDITELAVLCREGCVDNVPVRMHVQCSVERAAWTTYLYACMCSALSRGLRGQRTCTHACTYTGMRMCVRVRVRVRVCACAHVRVCA